jgi:hypothetical protein
MSLWTTRLHMLRKVSCEISEMFFFQGFLSIVFSVCASPNETRLPMSYAITPFCHACLTTQTSLPTYCILIYHQLMYLCLVLVYYCTLTILHWDPIYKTRLAEMPICTTALRARYPSAGKDCRSSVDENCKIRNTKPGQLLGRLVEAKLLWHSDLLSSSEAWGSPSVANKRCVMGLA